MTTDEKLRYLEKDTVAYYSGYGGIEIKEVINGLEDYVIYVSNSFTSNKNVHKVKIHWGERPYFIANGVRIHLDECIRNGI